MAQYNVIFDKACILTFPAELKDFFVEILKKNDFDIVSESEVEVTIPDELLQQLIGEPAPVSGDKDPYEEREKWCVRSVTKRFLAL